MIIKSVFDQDKVSKIGLISALELVNSVQIQTNAIFIELDCIVTVTGQ